MDKNKIDPIIINCGSRVSSGKSYYHEMFMKGIHVVRAKQDEFMVDDISEHLEWEVCGRCKNFKPYDDNFDFNKKLYRHAFGYCKFLSTETNSIANCDNYEART